MMRNRKERLTPLELEIMNVLWDTGSANVQTVQQQLKRELAYTTVQTMLNILNRKGKVRRTLKDRAYFYKPAASRSKFIDHYFSDIIERLFGGSAESLVIGLVETKHLTLKDLARLNERLERPRGEGR